MARLVLTWLLAGVVTPVAAQATFRLVSAQVVTAGERPPTLKLSANGPIAYQVIDDEGAGNSLPGQIRARLYGVTPGDIATLGTLSPFAVSVVPDGSNTLLTVRAVGLPAGAALTIKNGEQSNEIAVTVQD